MRLLTRMTSEPHRRNGRCGRSGIAGPHRFAQLHARVGGISQKMLSQNLKALARAGLVARHVAPTTPPQVTYSLTELGVSLAGPLTDLIRWFGEHGDELLAAQKHYDSQ
ncbi:winged helix-turn-helix transcriptional regulator [Streptomyces sp. NPDC060334]|uniref:winged helix-turn-helix transcriptional regulator n=2 Tax=unclassified Streptomyces TaxID=2593676 RepID=UPI00365302FE